MLNVGWFDPMMAVYINNPVRGPYFLGGGGIGGGLPSDFHDCKGNVRFAMEKAG